MKVIDINNVINGIAPFELAYEWDNVGLLIGDKNAEVTKVLLTLDADMFALDTAVKNGCNLVISHHPVIFKETKHITADDTYFHYVKNNVSVISAHTNLDSADGGIGDTLCALAGLVDTEKLSDYGVDIGRIADGSDKNIDILKKALNCDCECIENRPVNKICVVSGSGGSFLPIAYQNGCDTLITGECHHEWFEYADDKKMNVYAFGHFETENIILPVLKEKLKTAYPDLQVIVSERRVFTKWR